MSNITVSGPQDTLLAQANIKKVFMNVDNRFVQVPIGTALEGVASSALANKADLIGGKLDPAQLPDLAISAYLGEVANQAGMLALVGQSGDWCSRTDTGMVYVVTGNSGVVSGWTQLKYPASAVQSVCGLSGTITLAQLSAALSANFASTAQGVKADNAMPNTIDAVQAVLDAAKNGDATAQGKLATFQSSSAGDRARLIGGRYQLDDLLPRHTALLEPGSHIGMTALVNGTMTVAHDPTEGERGTGAIKVSVSAASDPASYTLRLPIPTPAETGVAVAALMAGPVIHYRVKCSDWSKVKRLYVGLTQQGGSTHYRLAVLSNLGQSRFGNHDPAYAGVWNNKYRTLVMQGREHVGVGSPTAWDDNARYFQTDGVIFTLITTGAVDLWFDRVYSVDWPVSVICPIIDGCYQSARERFISDFTARKWGWGASANTMNFGGIYPTYANLNQCAQAGADVFAHGHYLSAGAPAGMTGVETEAQFIPVLTAQRARIAGAGVRPIGLRWHQFLQNKGWLAGGNTAGTLKKLGINASRADVSDAEFGVNPYNAAYTTPQSVMGSAAFTNKRGRFNRQYTMGMAGMTTGAEPYEYDGVATLRKETAAAANLGLAQTPYFHQFLDNPTNQDNTPAFYSAWLAHLDSLVASGGVIVLRPTELELLTYWRPGDVYMRWDGEWVYRDDPTRIAF